MARDVGTESVRLLLRCRKPSVSGQDRIECHKKANRGVARLPYREAVLDTGLDGSQEYKNVLDSSSQLVSKRIKLHHGRDDGPLDHKIP